MMRALPRKGWWLLLLPFAAAGMVALLGGCTTLGAFDLLVPKDGGVDQVAEGVPYGGDPRQRLDVYAPTRRSERPRPVLVFFYGGFWAEGTREGYHWVGRALAAQGYVVIVPDYRLVPQVHYPAFVEDSAAAVRAARRLAPEFGGDPDRVVLLGHSAGAYNAAMLALDPRWLGPDRSAIRGWIGLAGPYDFYPFDIPESRNAFGRAPNPSETQPIAHAGPGDPPTLLLTGARDETVRPRNSEALAERLRAARVPVRLTIYPKIAHVGVVTALSRPLRNRAPVLADIRRFADQVTSESGFVTIP